MQLESLKEAFSELEDTVASLQEEQQHPGSASAASAPSAGSSDDLEQIKASVEELQDHLTEAQVKTTAYMILFPKICLQIHGSQRSQMLRLSPNLELNSFFRLRA